jgi:hypothetical protein
MIEQFKANNTARNLIAREGKKDVTVIDNPKRSERKKVRQVSW